MTLVLYEKKKQGNIMGYFKPLPNPSSSFAIFYNYASYTKLAAITLIFSLMHIWYYI